MESLDMDMYPDGICNPMDDINADVYTRGYMLVHGLDLIFKIIKNKIKI